MLTFVAGTVELAESRPQKGEYEIRTLTPLDTTPLGELYFRSYPEGVAASTRGEALEDITASFDGAYGPFEWGASLLAIDRGRCIGAVMVVTRSAWDGDPDCPFVIELFVHPDHRRTGVARSLLAESAKGLSIAGHSELALRVDRDNAPAVTLYKSVGFRSQ